MPWLKWGLIGLGSVAVLVVAMLAGLGMLSDAPEQDIRHISIGQRTITVSHYKDMTQESLADGVKIVADGHVILATADAITIDGKPLETHPGLDVEILIDQNGNVESKTVTPGAPPSPGADDEQPAEAGPE